MKRGVLVASDRAFEWALCWWFTHYQKHNELPIGFIDLGLSPPMKKWCKKRGIFLPLPVEDFTELSTQKFSKEHGIPRGNPLIESRSCWFKKPFACLHSPFEETLWLDIDCEVRGSISPLYSYIEKGNGFTIGLDAHDFFSPFPYYNSGVIGFRQQHPLLSAWADLCRHHNDLFLGDQDALSYAIYQRGGEVQTFPQKYNWSRKKKGSNKAVIRHWHGPEGKQAIKNTLRSLPTFFR